MLTRQAMPSALQDFARIGRDYKVAEEVDKWCRLIVEESDREDRPITGLTEVPLDQVLDELQGFKATLKSDWAKSLARFRAAGWLEKVKALKVLLTKRVPPWQLTW